MLLLLWYRSGPWNSWSRVPYITNIRTGKPSIIPEVRKIRNNFILATYFSQQAIDTDDGSAYYEVTVSLPVDVSILCAMCSHRLE